jgi:release factor glutamine methyltransferase
MEEYAWYCGPDFEYFDGLFGRFHEYLAPNGVALMILSEDCKIGRIAEIAQLHHARLLLRHKRWVMGEWNYIFEFKKLLK